MGSDLLRVVETGYTALGAPEAWLGAVADSARALLDQGEGVFGCWVDATDPAAVRFADPVLRGCPSDIWSLAMEASTRLTPAEQEANLRKPAVFATVSERLGPRGAFRDHWMYAGYQRMGLSDFSLLTSMDLNGRGFVLGSPRKAIARVSTRDRQNWALVAAHLRAGARLVLDRVAAGAAGREPSAVLRPDGEPLHLEADAQPAPARAALRAAAKSVDSARSSLLRRDPDKALAIWRGLVAGKWSLIDRFDSDGKRYLVAMRNAPEPAIATPLSRIERQVAGYAALGHTNKLIAYELGIGFSTVSSALLTAMLKLGVTSRMELAMLAQAPSGTHSVADGTHAVRD